MNMKTATIHRRDLNSLPNLPYPNAATRKELIHKFLDLALMAAIGAGFAAVLLFVVAFC